MDGLTPISETINRIPRTKTASTGLSEPRPEIKCQVCQDCGFVYPILEDGKPDYTRTVPCDCQREEMERKKRTAMLRYCNLPEKNWTFENFIADTPDLQTAFEAAKEVADPDGKIKWLVLMSKVDRGKTHLAVAICREYLKREIPAKFCFVPEMLDDLRIGQYAEKDTADDHTFKSLMHLYKTVPLLVLDDIATEKVTDWTREKLTTIINHRCNNNLPLVVTMNKKLTEIPGDEFGRIGSRLRRESTIIGIDDAPEFSLRGRK